MFVISQSNTKCFLAGGIETMGRFRIQLLSADNTWCTHYIIPKTDRYSDTAADWSQVSLNFHKTNME